MWPKNTPLSRTALHHDRLVRATSVVGLRSPLSCSGTANRVESFVTASPAPSRWAHRTGARRLPAPFPVRPPLLSDCPLDAVSHTFDGLYGRIRFPAMRFPRFECGCLPCVPMNQETRDVRWLTDTEMSVWRSYIVSTLMLRQRLHRELSERHALSLIDYEVMVCLSEAENNAMRMTELAKTLGSTKSRLSHQIARMEAEGYVRRIKHVGDRRGVTAELTQKGAELLHESAPTHVKGVRAHFVDLLTEQEKQLMGRAFSRVVTHLSGLGD